MASTAHPPCCCKSKLLKDEQGWSWGLPPSSAPVLSCMATHALLDADANLLYQSHGSKLHGRGGGGSVSATCERGQNMHTRVPVHQLPAPTRMVLIPSTILPAPPAMLQNCPGYEHGVWVR